MHYLKRNGMMCYDNRGDRMMYDEIEHMMNNIAQDHSSPCMWIGIFLGTGILLGA